MYCFGFTFSNEVMYEITKLLLEKEEVANNKGSIVIDGGDFRQ